MGAKERQSKIRPRYVEKSDVSQKKKEDTNTIYCVVQFCKTPNPDNAQMSQGRDSLCQSGIAAGWKNVFCQVEHRTVKCLFWRKAVEIKNENTLKANESECILFGRFSIMYL